MTDQSPHIVDTLHHRVAEQRDAIVSFLHDLVAIPSVDGNIGAVAARVERELRALGFEDVHYAPYGDIVGRIGHGRRVLLYDSHLDTVDVGDPQEWRHGPFSGETQDGVMYGRGTVDEKGSTPPIVYGLKIAHALGLLDGFTAIYFGSIEEWCEGLSARVYAEEEHVRPDYCVIGEPTNLRVARGQRGRCEFRVTAKGRSAHGASPWLGDNAVYKMQALIRAIPELDARLQPNAFLGRGSIVVTHVESREASFNAVPDRCSIVLDRRLTVGETVDQARDQVKALFPSNDFTIEVLQYSRPSYNGYVREVDQVFPVWAMDESAPVVQAAVAASRTLGMDISPYKWDFSTNGTYWAGTAGIPAVGFGPGEEGVVHMIDEHIRLDDVMRSAEWYASLPMFL